MMCVAQGCDTLQRNGLEEWIAMVWTTPQLVEIRIGLEVTSYESAEG